MAMPRLPRILNRASKAAPCQRKSTFPWFFHVFFKMAFLCFFFNGFPMVLEMLFETVNICDIHRTDYVSEVLLTFTQDAHTVSEDSPIVMTCYDFGEL